MKFSSTELALYKLADDFEADAQNMSDALATTTELAITDAFLRGKRAAFIAARDSALELAGQIVREASGD